MTTPPRGIHRCHHPHVSSVVLWDAPWMRRAFLATGDSGSRTVAPHSHRTSIRITVLQGTLRHLLFHPDPDGEPVRRHTFRSVLLGGEGLSDAFDLVRVRSSSRVYTSGAYLVLSAKDVHTVEWERGAVWLVDEGPVVTETTTVLLRPGLDTMDTDGLYEPMTDEEYLAHADYVWRLAATLSGGPSFGGVL